MYVLTHNLDLTGILSIAIPRNGNFEYKIIQYGG